MGFAKCIKYFLSDMGLASVRMAESGLLENTEEPVQPIAAQQAFSGVVGPENYLPLACDSVYIHKTPVTTVRAVVTVVTHCKQFTFWNLNPKKMRVRIHT